MVNNRDGKLLTAVANARRKFTTIGGTIIVLPVVWLLSVINFFMLFTTAQKGVPKSAFTTNCVYNSTLPYLLGILLVVVVVVLLLIFRAGVCV